MKVPEPKKLPSGNWHIMLRLGGEIIYVTEPTKSKCVHRAELIKAEYRSGKKAMSASSGDMTVGMAIDKYIADRSNVLSPSTVRGYKQIRDNRFQSVMDKKLSKVDWQPVVNREAKLCSPKTLKNSWGLIASVLKSQDIPVPNIVLPQVIHNDLPYLDADQIEVFLDAIKDHPAELLILTLLNGLRTSEAFALRKSSFNLKKHEIRVSGSRVRGLDGYVSKETNKTASSARTVPILFPRIEELAKELKDDAPICEYNQYHMHEAVNRICKKHDLPLVGCHGLRRSFASWCAHERIPEDVCMSWGGWSDMTTMRKIYQKIYDSDKVKYAEQMRSRFK